MSHQQGKLLPLPILLINLGGEMLYILEQRLRAQKITPEKSVKVLVDVANTMFDSKLLQDMSRPQNAYSQNHFKELFTKLAHSSIMKLQANSMSKLYDLMAMGVKRQILCCKFPEEIYQITLRHIQTLYDIINDQSIHQMLNQTTAIVHSLYEDLNAFEYQQLKCALLNFFQERHVKVSLFLQEGMQQLDGKLAIEIQGDGPPFVKIPGKVRYFSQEGTLISDYDVQLAVTKQFVPSQIQKRLGPDVQTTQLGENLYQEGREKKTLSNTAQTILNTAKNQQKVSYSPQVIKERSQIAKWEIESLANVLQTSDIGDFELEIDLFIDKDNVSSSAEIVQQMKNTNSAQIDKSIYAQIEKQFEESETQMQEEQNLLDLMPDVE